MKNKRFFLCNDTLSTISLQVPSQKYVFDDNYEVTMRDCSRQIHWIFNNNKRGLDKAKKVAKFYNELQAELERSVAEQAANKNKDKKRKRRERT